MFVLPVLGRLAQPSFSISYMKKKMNKMNYLFNISKSISFRNLLFALGWYEDDEDEEKSVFQSFACCCWALFLCTHMTYHIHLCFYSARKLVSA